MFWKNKPLLDTQNHDFLKKLIILSIFIAIAFLLYNIIHIIIILCFAIFLNILFAPFLNKLNSWRVGNGIWMMLIYIIILLFILITFFAIVPIFVKQIGILSQLAYTFINNLVISYNANGIDGLGLPAIFDLFLANLDINAILNSIRDNIWQISAFASENLKTFLTNGAGILFSITNMLFNFVLLFIFTFFIALERKQIRQFFYDVIPENISSYLFSRESQIVNTLSNWLKSQLLLGFCMFVITFLALFILWLFGIKLEGIFTLALIAGMMEFVPYLGPILALLPALAIALWISYKAAIIVVIIYIIIQQLENNVLVPFIMGKTLSLSPFSVLIGMMIGWSIFGIIWIIIAVPIVALSQIFIQDFLKRKKWKLSIKKSEE